MIDRVLMFLKKRLNDYLGMRSAAPPGSTAEDLVTFVDGDKVEPIDFKLGAVTALLINIEQEKTLRPPDPYARAGADGTAQRVRPDVRLNLYVLFVVRFKQYEDGLGYLSEVIRYFQLNPIFDHRNAPDLDDGIERLVLEMITLPMAQQNDLWGALRTTYQPSVLYRVGLIVYRDEPEVGVEPVREVELRTSP
jgi:hypothetical protein